MYQPKSQPISQQICQNTTSNLLAKVPINFPHQNICQNTIPNLPAKVAISAQMCQNVTPSWLAKFLSSFSRNISKCNTQLSAKCFTKYVRVEHPIRRVVFPNASKGGTMLVVHHHKYDTVICHTVSVSLGRSPPNRISQLLHILRPVRHEDHVVVKRSSNHR